MRKQDLQSPLTVTNSALGPVAAPLNTAKWIATLLKPQKKAKHALLIESQNPLVLTDEPESPYVVLTDEYLFQQREMTKPITVLSPFSLISPTSQ